MKKSDIEKRLQSDLNCAAPSDFAGLKKLCGLTDEKQTEKAVVFARERAAATAGGSSVSTSGGKISVWKFATGVVAFVLAVVLAITALFGIFGGKPKPVGGYFILDINPSVEIDYDGNGKVTGVVGLNEDGRVLLHNLDDQTGKTYDEVANVIVERCVKLGYFSVSSDGNAILVSATSLKGEKDETRTNEMKAAIAGAFATKKMAGVVITGVVNSGLEETAASFGVDVQKYGLIQDYLALCEKVGAQSDLSESEYAGVSVRTLYEMIDALEEKIEENEAFEPLAEKIGTIVESLEERCLGERYEAIFDMLDDVLEEMEEAKTKEACQNKLVELLGNLEFLKISADESVAAAIEQVKTDVVEVFTAWFAEDSFAKWEKSVEELFEEREKQHQHNPSEGDENFYDDWLNKKDEHEGDFSSNWFDKKNEWKEPARP